jgi:hypothetical protein
MFSNSKANADSEYRRPLLEADAQAGNHLDEQYDQEQESSALTTPRTAGGSKVVSFKEEVQVRIIAPPLRSTASSREAGELRGSVVALIKLNICS